MERLTDNTNYCTSWADCEFQDSYCKLSKNCYERKMYEKLKAYEDAEEQGLLLRLPCKVGDTIYKIWYKPCHHGEDHPDSYGCCGCEDDCDLEKTIFEFVVPGLEWVLNHFNVFGNYIWFLTKAEAEAALAEMEK